MNFVKQLWINFYLQYCTMSKSFLKSHSFWWKSNAKQYWKKNSRKHIKGTSSLRIIQLGFHWIATEIVANIEQCDISQLTSNTTKTTRHCAHISCHHWTGIRSRIMIFHFHPFVTFSKLQKKFFMQSRDLIHIYSWNYFPI